MLIDVINLVWGGAQLILVIACIIAAIFGTIVFLMLPFIGLYKLGHKLHQRLAFK